MTMHLETRVSKLESGMANDNQRRKFCRTVAHYPEHEPDIPAIYAEAEAAGFAPEDVIIVHLRELKPLPSQRALGEPN